MEENSVKKVLVLGSGALKIGEAGEFDYSGSQAIKALKSEGLETILVNPNIATIQTSRGFADEVYLVPVSPEFVEKVIVRERPDGILLSTGGQTALNCGLSLADRGVFNRLDVKVLGTPIDTIRKTEDRELFKQELLKLGLKVPKSITVSSGHEANKAAAKLTYPLIIRVAYALGGLGSRIVRNKEELIEAIEKALTGSPQVLIEEFLEGWKEIEYEVVRDCANNCITVCNMENVDPMGIHTGESIVVAPSQTLTNQEYHFLRTTSIKVVRTLGIIGECNIQFALNPKSFDYRIIEVNARLSRSSALASKATGYPLAYIATKLALGKTLDRLENSVTRKTCAFFEPALDYLVVKIPRWDLDKFRFAQVTIGSEMKSVGEVMGIGRSFEEAVQKAVRMLDQGFTGVIDEQILSLTKDEILKQLEIASPRRIFLLVAALSKGISISKLAKLTSIDPWFLSRLERIVELFENIKKSVLTPVLLLKAKQAGFSDKLIANITKNTSNQIRELRKKHNIVPFVKAIDTLAGEFPAQTNYLYMTYHATSDDETVRDTEQTKKMLILGSGPYRIGSSVEFDWCAVNAVAALKKRGFFTIMVNCNPETVSTDYDYADSLYFEELTRERILDIWEKEQPKRIILSVGGQTPNNLAKFCKDNGLPILGTSHKSIIQAEDRRSFSNLLERLAINQPPWDELITVEDVLTFARGVGYPILVRPSFVLSGESMSVLYCDDDVRYHLQNGYSKGEKYKNVVSKFMEGAKEIDCDGVADHGHVVLRAISEHVELAGVHSGDATLVLPPYRLGNESIGEIDRIIAKIASSLDITGPFNIQFLERNGQIMVIECNLRASRSFPFVSKVTGINFMDVAIASMLGEEPGNISITGMNYVGVKAAQFSFSRIKGSDPVLRVEMASTGEVAAFGSFLYDAFLKSLLSTGFKSPKKTIFLSVGGWENKDAFYPYAQMLIQMGYKILATDKTSVFLKKRGISCRRIAKLGEDFHPNAIDFLRKKKIDMVINITEPPLQGEETLAFRHRVTEGYYIRRTAIDYHVPLITNLELAMLFVRSLREKQHYDLEVFPMSTYIGSENIRLYKKGGESVQPIKEHWKGKDIVSVDQFSIKDLNQLFALTRRLKSDIDQGKLHKELQGKIMAAIFYEPSSRTFGSFVTAMQRLGGGIIPLQGVVYSSVAKGELLPDTVRTFASYADIIVLRYPEEGGAKIAAEYSPVPVINAGDGPGEHPTQALLDLFTIVEHFKKPDGLTIGMVGDLLYGRTIHSLSKLLALYKGINLQFISPDILKVKRSFKKLLKKTGVTLLEIDNLSEVINSLDVLYMTRVQKERFVDLGEYEKVKNYYILTPELMKKAKKDMIVMHPFPRVGEISYDVDSDPRAVYIHDEMRNGLFVRMALLLLILGKGPKRTK